jgi:hypothetical protein
MLPGDLGTIGAALLAIVPGFLAQSVWARARTWKGPAGDLRVVLLSLALSVVIQLILAPLTLAWLYPVRHQLPDFPERVVSWVALAVLVIPVFGGVAVGKLTNILSDPGSPRVRGRLRRTVAWLWPAGAPPSIWDWVFTVKPPHGSFVVVEFEEGRRVAGVFAEGSMALTSPEPQGLFLVSEWELDQDGNVIGALPDSAGVMILRTDDIRSVRILREEGDGQERHSS